MYGWILEFKQTNINLSLSPSCIVNTQFLCRVTVRLVTVIRKWLIKREFASSNTHIHLTYIPHASYYPAKSGF